MSARPFDRIASPHLGIASVAVAATAAGYLNLLGQQGSLDAALVPRVAVVVALLVTSVAISGLGTFAHSAKIRAVASAACAGLLLPLGVLAAFSIGTPLLLSGLLAVVAWRRALRDGGTAWPSLVAFIAAMAIQAIAFFVTP